MILKIENVHYQLKLKNVKDILVYLTVALKIALVVQESVIRMKNNIHSTINEIETLLNKCESYKIEIYNKNKTYIIEKEITEQNESYEIGFKKKSDKYDR